MSTQTMEAGWTRAASIDEMTEGEVTAVHVNGTPVALYQVDGALYATHDICTHEHAHLSDGYLEGCEIECPLHQGRFDIRTGKATCRPVTETLRVYPVRIVGKDVFIRTGAPHGAGE